MLVLSIVFVFLGKNVATANKPDSQSGYMLCTRWQDRVIKQLIINRIGGFNYGKEQY